MTRLGTLSFLSQPLVKIHMHCISIISFLKIGIGHGQRLHNFIAIQNYSHDEPLKDLHYILYLSAYENISSDHLN